MNISSLGRRLLAIADVATFGTILGLGTAAYKNTGTSGNTVPLLDGANTWSAIQTFSANPSVTGGAVSFPATQVPSAGANDLDDYEEGTSTPTVGSASGTITTKSATANYTKVGNRVHQQVKVVITTNGTGAGYVTATLPFTPSEEATLAGREIQATGVTLTGQITSGSTTLIIQRYDGAYPGADGRTFVLSGHYKV